MWPDCVRCEKERLRNVLKASGTRQATLLFTKLDPTESFTDYQPDDPKVNEDVRDGKFVAILLQSNTS